MGLLSLLSIIIISDSIKINTIACGSIVQCILRNTEFDDRNIIGNLAKRRDERKIRKVDIKTLRDSHRLKTLNNSIKYISSITFLYNQRKLMEQI